MPTIFAFFQQSRAYSSLTIQLETVIIEVSTVQVLRLKTNPRRVHKANYLLPKNGTYGHTGFTNDQASYLNMKVLIFARTWAYAISLEPLLI